MSHRSHPRLILVLSAALILCLASALGVYRGLVSSPTAHAQRTPLQSVEPANGSREVWPGTSIGITFDRKVDTASVEAALSVEPAAPGAFVWYENRVELRPREPLAPKTGYQVTLGTGARDANGRPLLDQPFRWSFTGGEWNQSLTFGWGLPVQLIAPSGKFGAGVTPPYPRMTLDFALYALDVPGFAERYATLIAGINRGEPAKIDVAGLKELARWSAHVDNSGAPTGVRPPKDVPPGLYVIGASHARAGAAQALVIYSDQALVAKQGRKGLTTWTAGMLDGQPASSADVTLVNAKGEPLADLGVDADGIARFDSAAGAAFAVATVDGHPTLVGLDSNWLSNDGNWRWWGGGWSQEAPEYAGHVHTDRPIYRPGHLVHFKASLRHFTGEGLAVVDAATPITATLRDAKGNLIAQSRLAADAFGSVDGQVQLGDEVALGDWHFEVQVGPQTLYSYFKVEDYVKPDYEVKLETDRPFYIRDESARVTVRAIYYFGQPAMGADLTLRVYRGYYYRGSGLTPIETLTGVIGPDGSWTGSVKLPGNESTTEPFSFEAEVTDASRRPVVSETSVPVHPAAFTLELANDRYGVEVGSPVVYTARTMGHDGQPAAGRKVDVEMRQWRQDGYDVVRRAQVTTGADGTAPLRFDGLKEGWYHVVATAADDAGRAVTTSSYAWLYNDAYPWYWWGGLELETDKPSYAPGDTVRLLIKSPVTTTALVTIERDDVHEELVVPVQGGTTVEFPIKPEYAPNVWVKVQIWKPSDNPYDLHEGQIQSATKLVLVPATDRRLAVDVVPDTPTHAPGEEATFTLRVRDATGRPVDAQVSLALVDKAVLALAPDRSGPIFDAFWGEWQNAVHSWDSGQVGQTYRGGMEDTAGPGGGAPPRSPGRAGDPGQDKSQEAVIPAPRREFRDTAYWNATITTGADGEAQVTLTLPDNLTTWQALARAITKTSEVGQGSGELIVTQPIIAEPALPRFAVQGDQFTLDVLGRNYAGGTLDGTCVLEAPGLVQLDPGERSLTLPFNETKVARWSVVASTVGASTIKAQLTTSKGGDSIELPLEIQPFTVPDRFVIAGSTTLATDEKFEVPFNAVPDSSTVEIRLAPGMALGVLDGIEELVGYPYGCVEQTMSKVLPNAVVGRLIQAVDLDAPEITDKLPEYMDLGLQKLYGFQNGDGSWGWWGGGDGNGNIYTTAYVLYGLAMVKEAGFTVEPNVLARGLGWLAGAIPGEKDPRLQAYAAYVLATNGQGDAALATALFARRAELDAFALGALAVTLSKVGQAGLAEQALDDLVARAKTTPTSAWWPLSDLPDWSKWDDYHWRSMASTEKSTAMALEALATLRPRDPLAPKAAAWLLEHRWGKAWPSTQATAFAILALTDHIVASGELSSDYAWTVRLDGVQVAEGKVDRSNVMTRIPPVVLTGPSLAPGPHQITFEKQGAGTLYYTVLGQMALYYPSFEATEAEGVSIAIKRAYTPISGRSGADGWHVGDVVNVRLTVDIAEDLHYTLIEDRLPAGLEGLNESLGTESSKVPGSDPEPGRPGRMPPWRWWGYERKEVHDDHVSFFASYLPAGTHVFEYAARAITPGTFSARPAEAYAMYRPEVWGRSASDQVAIDASRVARRPELAGDFDRDCRLTAFDASLVAADWAGGKGRDVTGDGAVTVADIATAAGRAGQQCGDTVLGQPGAAGSAALHLRAPGAVRLGEPFDLELVLDATGNVGAYEATLKLPPGIFEVIGATNGERVPGAYILGPEVDSATGATMVRLGGWASAGADGAPGQVLARLRLRPLASGAGSGEAKIDVTRAQVVTDHGGEYAVTATGTRLAPALWEPVAKLWLPAVQQQR